jgi:flagellar biosynthesis protein
MKEEKKAAAIEYGGKDTIPGIIAAGKGILADKLLEVAREHGITIYNDRDLAEVLAELKPGTEIPEHLFTAMAEVLAYCYRINESFRQKIE